jgi:hypothetical protein
MAKAPELFQKKINDIIQDMIDLGIVAKIDDILIYRQIKSKREAH